jgi:phytoene synthase
MTFVRPSIPPALAGLLPARARSFALAARFLPAEQRGAVVVLYAFCRVVDDLADEPPPGVAPGEACARLHAWRRWLAGGLGGGVNGYAELAAALRGVVQQYEVPPSYLLGLLDGVESDLGPVEMPDFAALRLYCLRVAGTVGLAMCHVLGTRQREALAAAAELGIAMQLTNVLRDLGSDLRHGRSYLPADELAQHGYTPAHLRALAQRHSPPESALVVLLRQQTERARGYYARGLRGVWLLPPAARPGVLVAGRLYRAILDTIEAQGYDVLRRRAVVSRPAKLRETLAALLLVRLWGAEPVSAEGAPLSGVAPIPLASGAVDGVAGPPLSRRGRGGRRLGRLAPSRQSGPAPRDTERGPPWAGSWSSGAGSAGWPQPSACKRAGTA